MSTKVKKNRSRSSRAGITFPFGRIHTYLRNGNYARRIEAGAAVYLVATLEYLVTEVLILAVDVAKQQHMHRIVPRHILVAIRNDDELSKLLSGVTISQAGVVSAIHPMLLQKKTIKTQSSQDSQ